MNYLGNIYPLKKITANPWTVKDSSSKSENIHLNCCFYQISNQSIPQKKLWKYLLLTITLNVLLMFLRLLEALQLYVPLSAMISTASKRNVWPPSHIFPVILGGAVPSAWMISQVLLSGLNFESNINIE